MLKDFSQFVLHLIKRKERMVKLEALGERRPPWPRQIITPILPNVKLLSLGGERLTQRFWIITCTTIWLYYTAIMVFFAHILILEYPDHHQNLISSSLYYPGPLHKFHPNPFLTF